MKSNLAGRLTALCILAFLAAGAQNKNGLPYLYDAALAPQGGELVFVSGGDIWTVGADGGEARLLVAHPAMETRPLYSPDGQYIAFNSTRTGNGDIYVLHIASGQVKRITYDDANDELNGWSANGQYLYFTSIGKDITGMRDVLRVKATGGTPMTVSDQQYVTEFFAAPAPDGKTLALVARGMGAAQWWRNGSNHLDESEIWLMQEDTRQYTRLAGKGAKQLWPMWSPDAKTLYYVSDRGGHQNIWVHPVAGAARQLTQFKNGRVLFPSIAKDGKTIVFERDFAIWKMDLATNDAKPLPIILKGAAASAASELMRLTTGFTELAVSPDGRRLAFLAQGELFVAGTKDGGDAVRVTHTPGLESSPVWTKNSNAILYASDRQGKGGIYQYDFLTGKETSLTTSAQDDGSLSLPPDGKKLAFIRAGKELKVLDLATKKETTLATAALRFLPVNSGGNLCWSPDGRHIAYAAYGTKSFRNIYVVPSAGGTSKPVSFLANTFGGEVVWSRDGNAILFTTAQRTENGQVARIDLQPRQPVSRKTSSEIFFRM